MSVYSDVGILNKRISYCVLRQIHPGANVEELRSSLQQSTEKLLEAAAALSQAFEASLVEARMKFAQVAKGSLNQYLSTPIKSDNEDVQRIIKDALEKYSEHVMPTQHIGIEGAWCSNIVVDASLAGGRTKTASITRKMLSAGKRSLKEMSFKWGKNASKIFESVYLLDTGTNVDALEYLLSKTPPVSSSLAVQRSRSALYAVLLSIGDPNQKKNLWDASIAPDVEETHAGEFVSKVDIAFERLSKEFNLHLLSLWRKKFSTSEGGMHVIRVRMIPDQKLLSEVIKWFALSGDDLLKKSLIEKGALIVREIIA